MTDAVRTLKEWTDAARKIVFFGGAGVVHGVRDPGFSQHRRLIPSGVEIPSGDYFKPYVL